jgi:peptidoglycan hydrolase-like protein with peptidoglycan-binding domain
VPGRPRQWRSLTLTMSAIGAVVVAVAVAGPQLRSPQQAAADAAAPPPSLITVPAEHRALVEPIVLRGHIRAGARVELRPPPAAISDESVVTRVAVRAGEVLKEGRLVLVRAGAPMFALCLPFPLYRDLALGTEGPDVKEVQRALRRLGYRLSATGVYDQATQRAIARFHTDRGEEAPGAAPAAAVVGTSGRDREAAGSSGDSAPGATGWQSPPSGPPREAGAAPGGTLSRASVLVLDRSGRHVSRVRVGVGSVLADPSAPIVELDGAPSYLVAIASREQVRLFRAGQRAAVFDDLTGDQSAVTITSVGTQPVSGTDGQRGFEVRFAFATRPMKTTGDRSVRIDIDAGASRDRVLAVPVTAVFSRPDGDTFVTATRPGGKTVDVAVTSGRIAGGWVEIEPAESHALPVGTPVVVGERTARPEAG